MKKFTEMHIYSFRNCSISQAHKKVYWARVETWHCIDPINYRQAKIAILSLFCGHSILLAQKIISIFLTFPTTQHGITGSTHYVRHPIFCLMSNIEPITVQVQLFNSVCYCFAIFLHFVFAVDVAECVWVSSTFVLRIFLFGSHGYSETCMLRILARSQVSPPS